MKVEKKTEEKEAKEIINKVEYYSRFKSSQMAFISGNFYRGGFSISKNKVKAILDNLEEMKKFVSGAYDEQINNLQDDEILKVD